MAPPLPSEAVACLGNGRMTSSGPSALLASDTPLSCPASLYRHCSTACMTLMPDVSKQPGSITTSRSESAKVIGPCGNTAGSEKGDLMALTFSTVGLPETNSLQGECGVHPASIIALAPIILCK